MPFIAPFIPMIIGGLGAASAVKGLIGGGGGGDAGGGAAAAGISTDIAGRPIKDSAILPGVVPPVNPEMRDQFTKWLTGMIGQGVPFYGGQLSPDLEGTMLPNVWRSWKPEGGPGQAYIQSLLTQGAFDPSKPNPVLEQLKTTGGTGGPGSQAIHQAMLYGAPSQAGQYVGNLAQFGVSSEGSGRPLADLAYGKLTGPAAFLAPFLTGQTSTMGSYSAPPIPQRDLVRRA